MSDVLTFILKSGGIGLISGIAVGFVSKKVSKIVVFLLAVFFIAIQFSIYNGYIEVDWLSWKDTALDAVKNTELPTDSIMNVFLRNIPFSIAAIIGFVFGFKKG